MKRLLQVSLDTLLISLLPIVTWLLLGFIITKDISHVFSLTYPLQFFFYLFIAIFGIGPNITATRKNKKHIVYSNMIIGVLLLGIATTVLILNVDLYIKFMSMNSQTLHYYCIYSIVWMYFSFCMNLITQMLYYEKKNEESNRINLIFNLTNFMFIIILSLLIKNQLIVIIASLSIDFIILVYYYIKKIKLTKFELDIISNIKCTSFNILRDITMFMIYGIGEYNSFSYGYKYISASNFEGLTTDTQWDAITSIDTVAKIDITKNEFNFKEHLKNGYKLSIILITTTLIMNFAMYWYYKPNFIILSIMLGVQIINMLVDPVIIIRLSYLQLNVNNKKNNLNYFIARLIRILSSFIPSGFCTYIGQFLSMIYYYFYTKIACRNIKELK